MIIQKSKTKLKQPIIFYSWPSAGMLGNYIINYLVSQIKASIFAEIDTEEYTPGSSGIVENGIIYSMPNFSDKIFYFKQKQMDFLFISATSEPPLIYYSKFTNEIMNFFQQLQPSLIITFSALPSYILHTDVPKLYVAKNFSDIKFFDELESLKFGLIEGINGNILVLAKQLEIRGVCIFAEIPFYTVEMSNPQAALYIIKMLKNVFSFNIDFNKVYEDIKLFDEKIRSIFKDIEQKTQKLFKQLTSEQAPKKSIEAENSSGITFEELKKQLKFSLPQSAKNRINELFKLASENIEYAKQLKEELDKWGVYEEYEDKFLFLFLKNKKSKNLGEEE